MMTRGPRPGEIKEMTAADGAMFRVRITSCTETGCDDPACVVIHFWGIDPSPGAGVWPWAGTMTAVERAP